MDKTSDNPRTVLITGASGALGPAVIRAFSADGWRVRTFSRRPPPAGSPASQFPHTSGDVCDRLALIDAMEGVDVVIHLAALLHVVAPPSELAGEYTRVNVDGTRAIIEAARARSVRRIVFASSICIYEGLGGAVDETASPSPLTPYARSKVEAERELLAARTADEKPLAVILRLGAVYGPTIKGNYDRLVRALERKRFIPVGAGRNRRTLIYEEDAAQAFLLAASHPSAAGRVFNVTDGTYHTLDEITRAICAALGRRPPRWRLPVAAVTVAAAAVEGLFRLVGRRPPVSRQIVNKYLEDVAVSGDAIIRDLGFQPAWNLEQGWRKALEMKPRHVTVHGTR